MYTQPVLCPNCRTPYAGGVARCTNCGTALPAVPSAPQPYQQYQQYQQHQPYQQGPQVPQALPVHQPRAAPVGADKKIVAGLCGILVGGWGVHKFILGYNAEGIILLCSNVGIIVFAFITCGVGAALAWIPSVIGLIEGIIYLTKSDEEFVQTYIVGRKAWF